MHNMPRQIEAQPPLILTDDTLTKRYFLHKEVDFGFLFLIQLTLPLALKQYSQQKEPKTSIIFMFWTRDVSVNSWYRITNLA
jgi:hypothetical protein